MTKFAKYCTFSLVGVIIASAYPIYMGFSVIRDMALYGTVFKENFPKYIIPYTQIAIAIIAVTALMPLLVSKKKEHLGACFVNHCLGGNACNVYR